MACDHYWVNGSDNRNVCKNCGEPQPTSGRTERDIAEETSK